MARRRLDTGSAGRVLLAGSSSALPAAAGGGGYTFARRAPGPWGGFPPARSPASPSRTTSPP